MLPTDAPAPFAEAYERLQRAQRDNATMTQQEREEREKAAAHATERNRIKRRMWRPY